MVHALENNVAIGCDHGVSMVIVDNPVCFLLNKDRQLINIKPTRSFIL